MRVISCFAYLIWAAENLYELSNGSFLITSAFFCGRPLTDDKSARSVPFPPITSPSTHCDAVLRRHDIANSSPIEGCFLTSSEGLLTTEPFGITIPHTVIFPSVSVPVLSVKSMFILPAASIPTGFLTSTLSFTILFIFDDRTTAIIIGNPSGTATTITVNPSIKA